MIVCSDGSALAIADEADYPDPPPSSSSQGQENLSSKGDELSSSIVESNESKQENVHGDHQYSIVQTSPNHSYGIMPPILGSQLGPLENSESQACDISRLPNVVVSLHSLVFTICSLIIWLHLHKLPLKC